MTIYTEAPLVAPFAESQSKTGGRWHRRPGLLAWPFGWQRPARTEEWAYEQTWGTLDNLRFAELVCFPWASLIDLLDRGHAEKARDLLAALEHAPPRATLVRATVCQHILAPRMWPYLHSLGITDLFWAHARIDEPLRDGVRIHPFPLYPVRCFESSGAECDARTLGPHRKHLYSFVGAYSPDGYMTPVRQWIFELPDRVDAIVVRRSEWHYEADVYGVQIAGGKLALEQREQRHQLGSEYDQTLQDSVFSLCPSGSGPNSIRLWESLGFGCIPVLLADALRLPGDPQEWSEAIVRVPETLTAVSALPALLAEIAADPARVLRMQQAGRCLWLRYGKRGPLEVLSVLNDTRWVRTQLSVGQAAASRA